MVNLYTKLDDTDLADLWDMIEKHYHYTDSTIAKEVLDGWEINKKQFVKVLPKDLERVLRQQAGESGKVAIDG